MKRLYLVMWICLIACSCVSHTALECYAQDPVPPVADPLLDSLKSTIADEAVIEDRLRQAAKLLESRTGSVPFDTVAPARVGEPARAVIVGPDSSQLGDLIVLDGMKDSVATAWSWQLANSSKTYLTFENDSKVVFATGTPGDYVFILSVATVIQKKLESGETINVPSLDTAKHVIRIGNSPNPNPDPDEPDPPTKPDPPVLTGLAKDVYDAAIHFGGGTAAKELAENFRAIATRIDNNEYQGSVSDATKSIIKDMAASNARVTEQFPSWTEFFRSENMYLRLWMNTKQQQGELSTLPKISAVFKEIATGLEAAR